MNAGKWGRGKAWLGGIPLMGLLACGGKAESKSGNTGGGSTAGGAPNQATGIAGRTVGQPSEAEMNEGGYAGESGGEVSEDPPWNEHSRELSLVCMAYMGSNWMSFRADRDQLSAEQLASLAKLERSSEVGRCGADYASCAVAITDDRGKVDLVSGGPCGFRPWDAGLRQLFETVDCGFESTAEVDLDLPPKVYSAVRGCSPSLFRSSPEKLLDLAVPGRLYHVELNHWDLGSFPPPRLDQMPEMQLFGSDPNVPIATGTPVMITGPDLVSVVLEVQVDEPVVARLVVSPASGTLWPYLPSFQFR